MNALMITGYKRHGKDHLLKIINGQECNNVLFLYNNFETKRTFESFKTHWERMSLADKLKEEALEFLQSVGIFRTLEDLEIHKDDKDIVLSSDIWNKITPSPSIPDAIEQDDNISPLHRTLSSYQSEGTTETPVQVSSLDHNSSIPQDVHLESSCLRTQGVSPETLVPSVPTRQESSCSIHPCRTRRWDQETLVPSVPTRQESSCSIDPTRTRRQSVSTGTEDTSRNESSSGNLAIRTRRQSVSPETLVPSVPLSCQALRDTEDREGHEDTVILSFRDILIALGKKNRVDNYYSKSLIDRAAGKTHIAITDWRFPKELEYIKRHYATITIRVFRSSCPIPRNQETENSLDSHLTDILCITTIEDLQHVAQLFSQDYYAYIA